MSRPKLQPNGLYDQKELEAYVAKCIGTTLLVSVILNAVSVIVISYLLDKIENQKKI